MKRGFWLCVLLSAAVGAAPAWAGDPQAASPELQKLDVSLGHWVFNGESINARSGQSTPFTWNENCQWSSNHLFLECTFSNNWPFLTVSPRRAFISTTRPTANEITGTAREISGFTVPVTRS